MYFSTQDLEVRKIHFDVNLRPGEVDLSDSAIRQQGEMNARGVVELLSNTLGEIRVTGHLKTSLAADCDRCLEPASIAVDDDFDLFFRPASTGPEAGEVEIHEGETEISFYDGEGLELEDILRGQILLSLPMRTLCRDDCKGICPVCGQNRNQATCSCAAKPTDDRWSALAKL